MVKWVLYELQVDLLHHHCMWETIQYRDRPPSYGPYRPLAPKYGVYKYLPPQRWLHTLESGGVAFLYHPCVDPEQVAQLKTLAESCLGGYVVTPYTNLTQDKVSHFVAGIAYQFCNTVTKLLWNP